MPEESEMREDVSAQEAARVLGVSEYQAREMCRDGSLRCRKDAERGRWRVSGSYLCEVVQRRLRTVFPELAMVEVPDDVHPAPREARPAPPEAEEEDFEQLDAAIEAAEAETTLTATPGARPVRAKEITPRRSQFARRSARMTHYALEVGRIDNGRNAGQFVVTALVPDGARYPDRKTRYVASRRHWDGRMRSPEQLGSMAAELSQLLWEDVNGDKTPADLRAEARARGEEPRPRGLRLVSSTAD